MKNKTIMIILASLIVLGGLSVGKIALANTANEQETTANLTEESNEEVVEEEKGRVFGPETRGSSISTSTPVPLWVSLGSNGSDFQNSFYDQGNIKIDGQSAPWRDLILTSNVQGSVDTITNSQNQNERRWYLMTISDTDNVSNYTTTSGEYRVNYGSSIVFGSGSNVSGAYTLHSRRSTTSMLSYNITAANGEGNRDTIINGSYAGQDYYSIEYFSTLGDWSKATKSVTAKGDDKKSDVLNKWSNVSASSSGVVRTWCANPRYNQLFTSNGSSTQEKNYADKEGYAYYKITEKGFEPLGTTPLTTVEQTISMITTDEQLDKMVEKSFVDLPDTVEVIGFTEYPSRSKLGKTNGKVKVSEKSAVTGNKTIESIYTVPFNVVEQPLEVNLSSIVIPVGTHTELLDANDYIEGVTLGDEELSPSDYIATFETTPNTMKVGAQKTSIKVETKEGNKSVVEETTTNIIWGHTIGSSADGTDKTPTDISVSMLHDAQNPYLVANDGNGLNPGDIRYDTKLYVYRGANIRENRIFYSPAFYPGGQAFQTRDFWNDGGNRWTGSETYPGFKNTEFHYGDVVAYETLKSQHPADGELSEKMWAARDEKLVKESSGYQTVYYEMTKDGFNALRLNQLEVNPNLVTVDLGTEKSDMDKLAKNTMIIPEHIANKDDYRFEFASVDTKTSGKKKTKVNVYEKLVSGGEFRTQYDVEYIVNSQVTETYLSETGTKLKEPKVTNVDLGKEYQGQPEKSMTISGDVYLYQGWLAGDKNPAKDKPTPGNPPVAKDTTTYQYVYKKADNMINMTIPTELLFETDKEDKQVSSKNYEIQNNSADVSTEVILEEFVKETGDVKLLTSKDNNPTKETKAARLNVMENNKVVINSLTEATTNQSIKTLKAGETTTIGLAGAYFGSMEESNHVNYHMNFKFKAGAN